MKKCISILSFMLIVCAFSSCAKKDEYIVNYPESYTVDYCVNNYIRADPLLVHLRASDNKIAGHIEIPGGVAYYRAIKDVPLDDYLLCDEAILFFAPLSHKIVKNKNNSNLPQQEILSYKIRSVILYYTNPDLDGSDKMKLGEKMMGEVIASIDGDGATAFQNHIIDCIETNNYKKSNIAGDLYDVMNIHVRVVFENYENLVWDSVLCKQNGTYYMVFHTPADSPDGGWIQNRIPINQELAELIP